jgi:hypothetical protein
MDSLNSSANFSQFTQSLVLKGYNNTKEVIFERPSPQFSNVTLEFVSLKLKENLTVNKIIFLNTHWCQIRHQTFDKYSKVQDFILQAANIHWIPSSFMLILPHSRM